MPNHEHVAVLRRGAAAWNAWRTENRERPDLSKAALRGLDLSGYNLSRADLGGANLRGTKFSGANLSGAHLEGANLFKAVLDGADLAAAFLYGAQFIKLCTARRDLELAVAALTTLLVARQFRTGNGRNKRLCCVERGLGVSLLVLPAGREYKSRSAHGPTWSCRTWRNAPTN